MTDISSRQNPKIKLARSLHERKGRQASGLFLVEGLRHLGELVDSDFTIEYVLLADETLDSAFGTGLITRFSEMGCAVFHTTAEVLDSTSTRSRSGGIAAVVRQKTSGLNQITVSNAGPLSVALVHPQNPGNIGTILRTMDAVGAGPLFLLNGGADPWQPAAVRASMGAVFQHPIVQTGFSEFAAWADLRKLRVYGTSARGTFDYKAVHELARPDVLLLGDERGGLTPDQSDACEVLVRIPMQGRGSSLNLAVAAGIMLFAMRDGAR